MALAGVGGSGVRILHWLEISNFKSYRSSGRIPLEHPSVLIGPNNCGKTTALQAIALWSTAVRTWQQESKDSKAKQRTGKPLNRLAIQSVPVPKTRHFWKNLKVSGHDLQISIGLDYQGTVIPIKMVFRHHASDELIYAEPHPSTANHPQALARAAELDVALLYPISGISADEPLITRNRIDYHMGRGSTAEVLRNLCLVVHQDSPDDWQEITQLMHRLFKVHLTTPQENEGGSLDLFYEQPGADRPLDLSLAGRGFQQMLLILAHLYCHKGSVLLIDEPDAHLEILRQQQIYSLLSTIADRNRCQVLMATHSEVVMQEALDNNLTLILDGNADDLASKPDIKESLKSFGAAHYVRARETGHVLYLEGSTDLAMLRAFADHLEHPVRNLIADGSHLNVYYLQDNRPNLGQSPEEILDAVEGAFGQKAKEHFFALRRILPELRGLEIIDNDNRGLQPSDEGGFIRSPWKRYELENYFVTPQVLLDWAQPVVADLFSDQRLATLDQLILAMIFDGSDSDFANYQAANPATQATLWRAQTQTKKLSLFAEAYFRNLANATGGPIMLRKRDLYRLIERCDVNSIDLEVVEKLDAIYRLVQP
jgi:ABC-type branched-subunit amino acid transport system ATPase component